MKKAKLVKVYAVMLIKGESMKEVFRSTDKNLCKKYKKENAKQIANKAQMPYCWDDIEYRLSNGLPLPFKLSDNTEQEDILTKIDKKLYSRSDIHAVIQYMNNNFSKIEDELCEPYDSKNETIPDNFYKNLYFEVIERAINSVCNTEKIVYEYEAFFDTPIIYGWYPVETSRIIEIKNIEQYIEEGIIRKISRPDTKH